MIPNEAERMGRLEEKVDGIKEDVTEIKDSIKMQTEFMGHFVPRRESEKVEGEQNRKIEALEKDVQKLKLWRSWLTGALAVLVSIAITVFEYGRQWFVSGNGH